MCLRLLDGLIRGERVPSEQRVACPIENNVKVTINVCMVKIPNVITLAFPRPKRSSKSLLMLHKVA